MNKKNGFLSRPFFRIKVRISAILFWTLLVFIPLYPKFPLQSVTGTYVSIRIDDVVVAIAIAIWIAVQLKNGFPVLKERIFKLFLLYFLLGAVSIFSAILIGGLVDPKIALLHFLRRVEYMSLFFVAMDALKISTIGEMAGGIILASVGVFGYGMGQKYFGLPVVSTMNEEFSKGILLYLDKWTRISSTFSGHYDLAAWLVMILSLTPALVSYFKKLKVKLLLAVIGVINFYMLILTASRISFVAYLAGVTITLLFQRSFRWLPLVLGLSLFFGFQSKELNTRLAVSLKVIPEISQKIASLWGTPTGVSTPVPLEPTSTPTLSPVAAVTTPIPTNKPKIIIREVRTWPKPEEIEAAAARSSQIRFKVEWPRAIRGLLKNPLIGSGYSSLGLATDNDYLRVLGETGIAGLLSFFLIVFYLFNQAVNSIVRERNLVIAGFLGVLIGMLANAIFIDVFEASKDAFYFWMLMGVMYQLTNSKLKIKNSK